MVLGMTSPIRQRAVPYLAILVAASLILLAIVAVRPAAAEETTTTSATTGDSTAPATTASTVGTTGETSSAVGEAAGGLGVTPAPEGYEPVNPGLVATQLGVQFWPEYDSDDVLVLVDVTLPATTVFPYTFSFYIPKGARLAGLAEITETGGFDYTLGAPVQTPGEVMDLVTVTVPKRPVLRLEYYYDPGIGAPGQKSFPVVFQAPADAGSLSFGVQQPLGASAFASDPDLSQSSTDSQGLTYFFGDFPAIKAGEMVAVQVSYTKTSADPSFSSGSSTSDPAQTTNSNLLLLMLAGIVLVVAGMVAYRLFGRREAAPAGKGTAARAGKGGTKEASRSDRQAGTRASGSQGSSGDAGGPARFCTECGGRLQKKDRFCPACGHPRES